MPTQLPTLPGTGRVPYSTNTSLQRPGTAATTPYAQPQQASGTWQSVQQSGTAPGQSPSGGGGFDLSQPGQAERAYQQNAPQLQRPSYGEQFFGTSGRTYDQGMDATAAGQYWQQVSGGMNQPRAPQSTVGQGNFVPGNDSVYHYSPNTYTAQAQSRLDPGFSQVAQYRDQSFAAGALPHLVPEQQSVAQYNNATFTGAAMPSLDPGAQSVGNMTTRTGNFAQGFDPSRGAPRGVGDVQGQTASGQYAARLDPFASGPGSVNDVSTMSQQAARDFFGSMPASMGAFYDRQFDVGSERLDRAMAARGMFGSSAALEQQRDLASSLGAQQARDEAQYGLQRAAEGRAGAQAADASALARFGMESDIGLQRQGLGLEAAGQADDAAARRFGIEGELGLGRQQLGLDAQRSADQADLARFLGETGYDTNRADLRLRGAMGADSAAAQRYGLETDFALGRGQLGLQGAQAADQAALGMFGAEADYNLGRGDLTLRGALGADAAGVQSFLAQSGYNIDRGQLGLQQADMSDRNSLAGFIAGQDAQLGQQRLGLDAARQADQSALGRYSGLLDSAQTADRSMIDRLGLLGQGAVAADNSRLDRVNSTFDNMLGLTGGIAGTVGGAYDDYFNSDMGIYDTSQQLGLGAGLQNLQGALTSGQQGMANGAAVASALQAGSQGAMQLYQALQGNRQPVQGGYNPAAMAGGGWG